MARVLVIGGGSELQPRLRRVAARMSAPVETVVMCRASSLPHVQKPSENRAVIVLSDNCPTGQWLRAARALHAEWRIETVASFADLDQDRAAVIAAELELPFHAPQTVRVVHDKLEMRTRLNESGLELVPFAAVSSLADLEQFCDSAGLPVIVKPSRGWASSGIGVIRSPGEMAGAYRRAVEADAPLFGPSPPMAERYYQGREFSVEVITHAGRHHVFAITEKFSDERTKVELGHVVPARLQPGEQAVLVEHVGAALTALGIRSGPTHTEVLLGREGPVVIETHLRDAGDEIPRLVEDATGVDMAELFLRQLLGVDIGALPELLDRREGPSYRGSGAIRYLAPPDHATLAGIDGWDAVRGMPGVQAAEQLVPDGTRLRGLADSFSRLGYVRVRADDSEEAVARARDALAMLKVRLRE
jgi:biotin carboxylase